MIIFFILILILILLTAFIICIFSKKCNKFRYNTEDNEYYSLIAGGNAHTKDKDDNDFVTLEIVLPHITNIKPVLGKNLETTWAIPIQQYKNPLPPNIKDSFWAFYPLTHFQSLIFRKPLQLNDYHLRVIDKNPQFKPLIDELLKLNKLDLFKIPCINLGIFSKYKQFTYPKLKYLQIGKNNSDYELLKLYRQKHISIRDKFEYIFVDDNLIDKNLEEIIHSTNNFDIIYFDLMCHVFSDHQNVECYANVLFSTLLHFGQLINSKSLVIIQITHYNSQFILDVITIFQHIFGRVSIIRTIMNLDIYQTRSIICEHFDPIKLEKILPDLQIIYKKFLITKKPSLKLVSSMDIKNSIKLLTEISEKIGNNRLDHIKKTEQLMYLVYSTEKNEIDLEKLRILQDSEKLKAIKILNSLGINPNFTLLFSPKDVDKFIEYDYPLLVCDTKANSAKANSATFFSLGGVFQLLESELFLHKAYLHRVEWKKFKHLDTLFRRTKILKQIIRDKKLIHKSWQLSQAFFKMIEILHECNLPNLPSGTQNHSLGQITNISAFHICEAPGQFIKACQKYVDVINSRGVKLSYTWNAQSLRATDTNTALDDVYGFLSDPQMKDNWLYGSDNTGDITSYENILNYEQISKIKKYNIVTSDCGIQFAIYEFQEEEIEYINYSQFVTMLLCLQQGGSCAMKVFLPLARPMALYMGHLLFEYFEEVIYFKPSLNLTSSEIYLVGKGYKTIPANIRDEILSLQKNKMNISELLPKLNNDKNYLINIEKHYHFCNKLVFNSISCINKYLFFYYYMDEINGIEKKIKTGLYSVSEKWIKKYF